MDTNDLLFPYRVVVDGELRDEGLIYREWFTFLFLVYEMDNSVISILVNGEWNDITLNHGSKHHYAD